MQGLLFNSTPGSRLDYWAGYSWGMPLGEMKPWCRGVVVAPKWVTCAAREVPHFEFILDNGAFGAWAAGESLSLSEQLDGIIESLDVLDAVRYVIAPDVVGDSKASLARTLASFTELSPLYREGRLLLPMQEGADTARYIGLCKETGCGLFIGGATKRYKRRQLEAIRRIDKDVYVHIGRISKDRELYHASFYGAQSFDTTTFMRQQDRNKAIDWRPRFERYVRKCQYYL